nr:hypothetical protein [uncultured Desulfuromonas sp.]
MKHALTFIATSLSFMAIFAASLSFMAIFAASATPIPLYEIYRRADGLSYSDLSLTAVVYFIGAVTALLVFGRISDHLGRKVVTLITFAWRPWPV